MLWRWDFTVFASITNSCAISTFDNPPSTSRKISRSRRLSVSADIVDHAERHKDRARRRIGLMRPYQDGGFGRMIERQTLVGDAECRAQFATDDVNTGHVARCKQAGRAQPGELPGVGVRCRAFPRRRSHKIKWAHVRPADWKTASAINGKDQCWHRTTSLFQTSLSTVACPRSRAEKMPSQPISPCEPRSGKPCLSDRHAPVGRTRALSGLMQSRKSEHPE